MESVIEDIVEFVFRKTIAEISSYNNKESRELLRLLKKNIKTTFGIQINDLVFNLAFLKLKNKNNIVTDMDTLKNMLEEQILKEVSLLKAPVPDIIEHFKSKWFTISDERLRDIINKTNYIEPDTVEQFDFTVLLNSYCNNKKHFISGVLALINKGAIVTQSTFDSHCRNGNDTKITQLLINKGAKITQSSLLEATKNSNDYILKYLLSKLN